MWTLIDPLKNHISRKNTIHNYIEQKIFVVVQSKRNHKSFSIYFERTIFVCIFAAT